MRNWKRACLAAMTSALLTVMTVVPAYAAGWQWIDTDANGVSECYYVGDDGAVLKNTTTPDGYLVNEQGAWIVDGVVQTQAAQAQTVQTETTQAVQATPSKVREHTTSTSQLEKFDYMLYTPKNATADMPLVVYLHGHGLGGTFSAMRQEKYFTRLRADAEVKTPAYILAPILPDELDFGPKGMWPGIEQSLMELIESVVQEYQIDRTKISIMGASMGADAAIQIVPNHPEMFSCMTLVVPFHYKCPIARWDDAWGEKLAAVPTWMFVEDESEAVGMATAAQNAITAAGGQAWVEVQKGADHGQANKRTAAYMSSGTYAIYDWMLSVSR